MERKSRWASFCFAIISLAAIGCGPKVTLAPEFATVKPRLIALLPTKAPSDVREERVKYLEQSIESGLKSRGFALIDRQTVRKWCKDQECTGRKELWAKYPVQGLFRFELESVSRNNFGIGYYNTITGKLSLTDANEKELLTIEHTERERGGVLFESGQVIQGLIQTVRNAGDDSYNQLADRYARTLALRIPEPTGTDVNESEKADLGQVVITSFRPEVYQICADASPGSTTTFLVKRLRVPLRPVTPGKFCGIFRLNGAAPDGPLIVEARSAFGEATRREIPLHLSPSCDLNGKIHLATSGKNSGLRIDCTPVKGKGFECSGNGQSVCEAQKFLVYRSTAEQGPYEKVAEVRGVEWFDTLKGTGAKEAASPVYHVVAVRPDGGVSRALRIASGKN